MALAAESGKVLALQLSSGARVALRIGGGGRLQPVHAAVDADCEARLSGFDGKGTPRWKVRGDAALLKAMSALIEGAGENASASWAGRTAKALWSEAGDAGARLGEALRRYFESEQELLATRGQLAEREILLSRLDRRIRETAERAAVLEHAYGKRRPTQR